MPPNLRSNKDHDDWRAAMRAAWRYHPTLTFLATLDNSIVAIGGWVKPAERPSNDNNRA